MTRGKQIIIIAATLLVGVLAVAVTLLNAPEPVKSAAPVEPLNVPFAMVEIRDQAVPIPSRGRMTPARTHKVVSSVTAMVEEISDDLVVGAAVNQGDLLVTLDDTTLQLDIAQKQATLHQFELKLAETEVQAKVAARSNNRNASEFARFVPQLRFAKSQTRAAREALEVAQQQLADTRIQAPISGKIIEVFIRPGDLVQASAPVALMYDMTQLEVRLPLSDEQLGVIAALNGNSTDMNGVIGATVQLRNWKESAPWTGEIVRIEGQRGANQLIYVVARVADEFVRNAAGKALLPGTFVEAEVRGLAVAGLRIVPRNAVQPDDFIWILDADNRVFMKRIEVLYRGAEHVYVSTPIPAGTRVVTGSFQRLIDGMSVNPVAR